MQGEVNNDLPFYQASLIRSIVVYLYFMWRSRRIDFFESDLNDESHEKT